MKPQVVWRVDYSKRPHLARRLKAALEKQAQGNRNNDYVPAAAKTK